MPRRLTLSSLRTSCKQQVDLENHGVVSDAEWASFISRAFGELYCIVSDAGLQYFEYATSLTTDGTNQLSEVSDHLSTVTLAYVEDASAGKYRDLREVSAQDRSRFSGRTGGHATHFALVDDKIYLYPTPPTGQLYQLRYVPQPPDITTFVDSDCLDVVTPDGHDFLILSVAVRVCGKTESDPTLFVREREMARERFINSCRMRAALSAKRIQVDYDDGDLERW